MYRWQSITTSSYCKNQRARLEEARQGGLWQRKRGEEWLRRKGSWRKEGDKDGRQEPRTSCLGARRMARQTHHSAARLQHRQGNNNHHHRHEHHLFRSPSVLGPQNATLQKLSSLLHTRDWITYNYYVQEKPWSSVIRGVYLLSFTLLSIILGFMFVESIIRMWLSATEELSTRGFCFQCASECSKG